MSGTLREMKGVVELDGRARAMVNIDDAGAAGISDGDEFQVLTRSGALDAVATVCDYVPQALCSSPSPTPTPWSKASTGPPPAPIPAGGTRARIARLAPVVG